MISYQIIRATSINNCYTLVQKHVSVYHKNVKNAYGNLTKKSRHMHKYIYIKSYQVTQERPKFGFSSKESSNSIDPNISRQVAQPYNVGKFSSLEKKVVPVESSSIQIYRTFWNIDHVLSMFATITGFFYSCSALDIACLDFPNRGNNSIILLINQYWISYIIKKVY